MARQARHDWDGQGAVRSGSARQAGSGPAWTGKVWQAGRGVVRQGADAQGGAGEAWRGAERHVMVWQGRHE